MVGAEFMVAPVLDAGQAKARAYLPAGQWVHLWSGKQYGDAGRGVYVEVDAPLGQPAVFYQARSAAGEKLAADLLKAGIK
jgi:alpha-glucosidase